MRALGIDWGGKRIGVAVGDRASGLARACPPLAASGRLDADADALARLARREEVDLMVLGEPLDAEGGGRMARVTAQLAERLRARGWRVDRVDEALTSVEAEAGLRADAGLTAADRRRRLDGEAACRILERWFGAEAAGRRDDGAS